MRDKERDFLSSKIIQTNKLDTYNSSVNSDIKYQNFRICPIKIYAVPEHGGDGRAQHFTLCRKQL